MSQHGNHQIRRNELPLFIRKHHPVSITVINDTYIRPGFPDQSLKGLHIPGNERIRLVIRETSVHLVEDIFRRISENIPGKKHGHPVGQVECNAEPVVVALEFEKEIQVVFPYVHLMDGAFFRCRNARPTFLYPFLYLSQPVVQSYRKCIFHRDLEAVVISRIMRGRYLYRSLESVAGGPKIYHGRSAEPQIENVSAGISDTFYQIFVYFRRRHPAIPPYQHLAGSQQSGEEISHLINNILVKIHIVDSSDVVCMKRSHNFSCFNNFFEIPSYMRESGPTVTFGHPQTSHYSLIELFFVQPDL